MLKNSRAFSILTNLFEISKYAVVSLLIIVVIVVIVGTPLLISGQSMMPNFKDKQIVAIERLSYFGSGEVKRGDVVAAKFPADPKKTRLIKRVVGLPGERIMTSEGEVYINDQLLNEPYPVNKGSTGSAEIGAVVLKNHEYFLMGDNRPHSSDSRIWGPAVKNDLLGRAFLIIFPVSDARLIDHPNYDQIVF